MVGNAAKGLEDDEGADSLSGPLNDLGGNEDPFTGIIGVGQDGVGGLRDVPELCSRNIQGMLFCCRIDKIMGHIKDTADDL